MKKLLNSVSVLKLVYLPHGLMAELSAITKIVKVLLCDDLINNRLTSPGGHLKTTEYIFCYNRTFRQKHTKNSTSVQIYVSNVLITSYHRC